jgi:hypothetical protein
MSQNIPLPSDITDPIALADWLEMLALTSPDGNASHGDLQRVLNRLGTSNTDVISTACMNELHSRVSSTDPSYPFTFSGTLLRTKGDWREFTPYVFCLLLSFFDEKKRKVKGLRHEVMFEQLSCTAARKYIGGEALRFGSPRQDPVPSGFRDALVHLCGLIGEWAPPSSGRFKKQDGGLDLVAWRHFPDRLIGKLILFGHCASGNNWDSKVNELQPDNFCSQWLGGAKSPIVKTFFIPFRLRQEVFGDRAIAAKLFFDRCRIAHWADNKEFKTITKGANERWCKQLLKSSSRRKSD